jgi:DNA primase
MSYPYQYVRALLDRVDIVEIVRLSIRLKTRGSENQEFVGLCPFHQERTPSFVVKYSRQFYHCFGCGIHGNTISFLKEYRV